LFTLRGFRFVGVRFVVGGVPYRPTAEEAAYFLMGSNDARTRDGTTDAREGDVRELPRQHDASFCPVRIHEGTVNALTSPGST